MPVLKIRWASPGAYAVTAAPWQAQNGNFLATQRKYGFGKAKIGIRTSFRQSHMALREPIEKMLAPAMGSIRNTPSGTCRKRP